jgi:F420-non-reducing hydrogenase iron-sulfur subunit
MAEKTPTIVCFSCNFAFCGVQESLPDGAVVARVQCIGRLDPSSVLEMFEKGADGVILGGCKPPNCHFQEGSEQAELTVSVLKRLLNLSGLGAERLKLTLVSPLENQNLICHVKAFSDEISKLGVSPLKSAETESKYMVNLIAARNVASEFRTRVLFGREKECTENVNSYGERISKKDYDAILDEIVGDEFIRYVIHFLTRNVPMSVKDLAEATGLKPSEVLEHIVDMRRKNMLAVERLKGTSPLYRALEV